MFHHSIIVPSLLFYHVCKLNSPNLKNWENSTYKIDKIVTIHILLGQCNIVVCTFSSIYRRAEKPENDVCGTYDFLCELVKFHALLTTLCLVSFTNIINFLRINYSCKCAELYAI